MNTESTLPWVSLGISVVIFLLSSTTGFVFNGLSRRPIRGDDTGYVDDLASHSAKAIGSKFNGKVISLVAHAVSTLAIVAVSLSLLSVIQPVFSTTTISLLVAGSLVAISYVLHLLILRIVGPDRFAKMRILLYPVAMLSQIIGNSSGIRSFEEIRSGGSKELIETNNLADATLGEELELLEAVGLDQSSNEARMIRAVLELDTARVREIMRPRVDMIAANSDCTVENIVTLMTEHGYSRIPIYEGTIDTIVGVVHAQDLLRNGTPKDGKVAVVSELARQTLFVPESQKLELLIQEFQRARTQIAIVVDEHGGVSGLVTVEDFVEEIVGDLTDEFDRDEPEIRRVTNTEIVIDARLPLDTLKDEFGISIEGDGFDTVGGLVYKELGKMPTSGDTVNVSGLAIRVESTVGRRISRLRIKRS